MGYSVYDFYDDTILGCKDYDEALDKIRARCRDSYTDKANYFIRGVMAAANEDSLFEGLSSYLLSLADCEGDGYFLILRQNGADHILGTLPEKYRLVLGGENN